MKKYTAEEIYGICRDITNQLGVAKQEALKEYGDDYEADAALELKFKRPDGTHVQVKISSSEDVLELVEKYGYCDAEELAKARELLKQDAEKTPVQKACEELDKTYAELSYWKIRLGDAEADYEEAQSDYEDACDKYKTSLQDI